MKLYNELADWWHLLSPPEEYEEEARLYWEIISRYKQDINTALELGSGGGNNAFYLKQHCHFTLTDLSPAMLQASQKINPECEHIVGDMRSIELEQEFDLVFIHDAIAYMTSEEELSSVFQVVRKHLKPGGMLFIAPDFFEETYEPSTISGGYDDKNKGIRYLEWTYDLDPDDHKATTEYAYILRDENGAIWHEHDRMENGLFSKATWQSLLEKEGFAVHFETILHSEFEPGEYMGIVAL
ncbi:MAG: class I SAM-dependent methyltransferase [Chitinophagales bacterium]|nr:class I SAM-dependent methyltransferase [Chitinophagales bacterium]